MKVITAVEHYNLSNDDISVFLAGGITNCWEWQDAVIAELKKKPNTDKLIVFNPRRKNFPIHDPNASKEQIEWEFRNLGNCEIFSMYFCSGDSDQPICMYELGRNLLISVINAEDDDINDYAIISCEEGYRRKSDVEIQSELATGGHVVVDVMSDKDALVKLHADKIYNAYVNWVDQTTE